MNMRRLPLHLISASFILFYGCAKADTGVNEEDKLSAIREWTLIFDYESGSIEQLQKSSGASQVDNQEQASRNLALKNDLFTALRDDYNIAMVKENTGKSGEIQIHPLHFAYGIYFKSLKVELINSDGETVGQLTIQNGGRNALTKNDRTFTKYAANVIAGALINYW